MPQFGFYLKHYVMQNEFGQFRLFICIELSEKVKQSIAAFQAPLQKIPANIAWTPLVNSHLTLKFLGNTEKTKVEQIRSALLRIAAEANESKILFDKTGVFPGFRKPRVLWLGCSQTPKELTGLATKIDEHLSGLGFQPEKRVFQPHLTLGRVRAGDVRQVIEKMQQAQPPKISVPVKLITLMRSRLAPSGAVYTPLTQIAVHSETVGE